MTGPQEFQDITLKLYNSESRVKEELKPLQKGRVLMYTCGPTVYNFAHIGNFRTYVFEDLLRRTIKFFGFNVNQAMNLTDIDDKTIAGAIKQNVTLSDYTRPYIEAFFEDLKTLNIETVEYYPAATEFIPQMIEMIQQLMNKGVAYEGGDGSIYFAIRKFPRYGCLSHFNLDELKAGASTRVTTDEYDKDHLADFVLWKKYDSQRDGQIYWESPFGKGRPGWHLECSTMAMSILGETIDLHVGGIDNMFPHHENEIAQSEACSGKIFAKIWMHSEHLVVDGKKMSKSLGNFFTLRDLLAKGYTGTQIRYMLLHTHYKTQLNFTFEGLDAVKMSLQRLQDFVTRIHEIANGPSQNSSGSLTELLPNKLREFAAALADDLNISKALAVLFDLVREVNSVADEGKITHFDAVKLLELLSRFNQVLNILNLEKQETSIPQEVQEAFERRLQARHNKDWALADSLRDYIHLSGYIIEDTPTGARLKLSNTPNLEKLP